MDEGDRTGWANERAEVAIVVPGRYQPPHIGHVSAIEKIARRDPNVLANPDSDFEKWNITQVITVIGWKRFDEENFLSVGTRRNLMSIALRELDKRTDVRLLVEWHPDLGDPVLEAMMVRQSLPINSRTKVVFATGNAKNLCAYQDAGISSIGLADHPEGISGTRIRKAAITGEIEYLREALPERVLPALLVDSSIERLRAITVDDVAGLSQRLDNQIQGSIGRISAPSKPTVAKG